jgi:Domain of unknown function (DUF4258)
MRVHEHARERMRERGASEAEVEATIRDGERFPAKFGREGFRRNFRFDGLWRGRRYRMKQIEAFDIYEDGDWLVISVIVKYF